MLRWDAIILLSSDTETVALALTGSKIAFRPTQASAARLKFILGFLFHYPSLLNIPASRFRPQLAGQEQAGGRMKSKRRKMSRDKRNGQYSVRFQVGGVRKYFPLGTSRKKAEVELTRLEKLHASGELDFQAALEEAQPEPLAVEPAGEEITLKELTDVHLEWELANRKPGTYELRERYLLAFLHYAGDRPVPEVDKLTLAGFHGWAKKNHSRSENGGNMHLRHVKTALLWAEDMGLCGCPVKKFPRMSETPPETIRSNDEEMSKLITVIPDDDFRDMVIFGFLTGLRPQELRLLEQQHVKEDDNGNVYLLIERHKTAKFVRQPKPRSVPLVAEAVTIARGQIAKHPKCPFIFVNGTDKPYTGPTFRQRFQRWCERAGIPVRPPYAMRHTFGSMQAEANINQACLSHLMGHSQIRTTSRYVTPTDEYHRQAIASIKGRILNCTNGHGVGDEADS
jgi:integrase